MLFAQLRSNRWAHRGHAMRMPWAYGHTMGTAGSEGGWGIAWVGDRMGPAWHIPPLHIGDRMGPAWQSPSDACMGPAWQSPSDAAMGPYAATLACLPGHHPMPAPGAGATLDGQGLHEQHRARTTAGAARSWGSTQLGQHAAGAAHSWGSTQLGSTGYCPASQSWVARGPPSRTW